MDPEANTIQQDHIGDIMLFRNPKRQMVDNYLDDLIVGIYVRPEKDRIDRLREAVKAFEKKGYNMRNYIEIVNELDEECEWVRP